MAVACGIFILNSVVTGSHRRLGSRKEMRTELVPGNKVRTESF